MPVGKRLSSVRLEASPLLSLLWQMQMLFMLYNVWCFCICESGKSTWSVSISEQSKFFVHYKGFRGVLVLFDHKDSLQRPDNLKVRKRSRSMGGFESAHMWPMSQKHFVCSSGWGDKTQKKCVKNGYTLRWCCFKVQKRSHVHTHRAITESQMCPRDGRLASHEITKQIEAHRLRSSNVLNGSWDFQISWMYVCLMDIKEERDGA